MTHEGSIQRTDPLQEVVQVGAIPPITWDHASGQFTVVLTGVTMTKVDDEPRSGTRKGVQLRIPAPALYALRLRKTGDTWGPGYILPVNSVGLTDLEPNTGYEIKVTEVDHHGNQKPGSEIYRTEFRSPPIPSEVSAK